MIPGLALPFARLYMPSNPSPPEIYSAIFRYITQLCV
eukprot:COSAG03_NODE_1034_length_4987_cov_5.503069_4_plen_37_part_00